MTKDLKDKPYTEKDTDYYVIFQSNIPMMDMGNFEIIKLPSNKNDIEEKLLRLNSRAKKQLDMLYLWEKQGGVLTKEQVEKLHELEPKITAYLIHQCLPNIISNVDDLSLYEYSILLNHYENAVISAIHNAQDTILVDENITAWIESQSITTNV